MIDTYNDRFNTRLFIINDRHYDCSKHNIYSSIFECSSVVYRAIQIEFDVLI